MPEPGDKVSIDLKNEPDIGLCEKLLYLCCLVQRIDTEQTIETFRFNRRRWRQPIAAFVWLQPATLSNLHRLNGSVISRLQCEPSRHLRLHPERFTDQAVVTLQCNCDAPTPRAHNRNNSNSHRVEVVYILDDHFSQQILLVHDGRVACTYKFSLHGSHFDYRLHWLGLSSPVWYI